MQAHQRGAGIGGWQGVQPGQVQLAAHHSFRGGQNVGRAETHLAPAQLGLSAGGQSRGRREGKAALSLLTYRDWFAELLAQKRDDLLDLDDLLRGGADEGDEAFPRLLPQQAQPATSRHGGAHRLIVGEGGDNGGEVHVELEEVAQPIPVRLRDGGFGSDEFAYLMQAHAASGDDAFPSRANLSPPKRLAGRERRGEVVVANGE